MRRKIHITIDEKILKKIEYIASELYISKSIIFDNLMEYTIKRQIKPSSGNIKRKKITTTVNPIIWHHFKEYADNNNLKYNALLEEALLKSYRNFTRKIKKS